MTNITDWDENKQDVSLNDMTKLIQQMREAKDDYDRAKKESNKLYERYQEFEVKVLQILEASGLSKFNIPSLGTTYTINKYRVSMPKDLADKRKLFTFIRDAYGEDVVDEYRNINHNTLNAFYKSEMESALERGDANFKVPGIEDPIATVGLGFKKDSK